MEQLAPPGSIRLTVETLRLAEGFVQVTALGPVPVKGLVEPVEVFELVGAGPARTRLQAAEFLYETRLFPEPEYTFKHALTHDIAYGSLLQEQRRVLHAHIVDAMATLYTDHLAEQVERLAHHALRGEVWDKAVAYCRQAGEKAMARSAFREAVGSCEQALSALAHLPEMRDTREQAIDLRFALRAALIPSGDFGRLLAALHEAEALAEALDDPHRLGQVSAFLANYFYIMGAYDQPSTPPSAPSRSPRSTGMSSCTRWRTSTSVMPTGPRGIIVGRSTASGRPSHPSTGRGVMSASG
jgi:hypothetical protein